LEDISYDAPDRAGEYVEITPEHVRSSVGEMLKKADLHKHIL